MQFAVGSVLALTMWALNLHERPKLDKDLVGHLPAMSSSPLVVIAWPAYSHSPADSCSFSAVQFKC